MLQPSIWEAESFYRPCDVLVVGSGFVGLWSAYYLKKKNPKLRIVVLDRGTTIPSGASTRNAGFACFGSLTELLADTDVMGESSMLEIVEMRFRGLRRIQKTFRAKDIDYQHSGGYELIRADQGLSVDFLRTQMDRMNHLLRQITGQPKAYHLNDSKLATFGFSGIQHLIENRMEGQLHAGKLCAQLIRLVQSMGVTLLNGMEVQSLESTLHGLTVHTTQGIPLNADQVLICTNAFARQLLPDMDVEPARGQILVTAPLGHLKFRGTFHMEEGFYYFRDLGHRVLLGGARNRAMDQEHTFDFSTSETIQKELEKFLVEVILPDLASSPPRIEWRWSGIMGVGKEKKPLVMRVKENVFCAVRMAGMGVALAPEVGKHISALMLS